MSAQPEPLYLPDPHDIYLASGEHQSVSKFPDVPEEGAVYFTPPSLIGTSSFDELPLAVQREGYKRSSDLYRAVGVAAGQTVGAVRQDLAEVKNNLVESQAKVAESEEALELARIDPVTGLKNGLAFKEEYYNTFNRSEHPGLVYLDLEGLRRANRVPQNPLAEEEHLRAGHHAVGDAYLRAVAQSIKRATRVGDEVYRSGERSDEIIIVIPETDLDGIRDLMARLKVLSTEAIEPLNLPENVYPGLSIGGAVKQSDEDTADIVKARADAHCEEEKRIRYDRLERETGLNLRSK